MRKTLTTIVVTAMAMSVVAFAPAAGAAPAIKLARPKHVTPTTLAETTGDVTVAYYAGGGEGKAIAAARGKGASLKRRSKQSGVIVVDPPAGVSADEFAAQMEETPGIRYAEPVRPMRALLTPNDEFFVATSSSGGPNQWGLFRIHMPTAWEVTTGSPSVKVAVVDTGLDFTTADHPVHIDTVNDRDFISDDYTAEDLNGHGTHTAGVIAAATNNSIGVAGVAPNVTILPIRVLDALGLGDDTGVADGIRWAADHDADIINLSVGGPLGSPTLKEAVDYAVAQGCVVVAASGNDADHSGYVPGEMFYPARYPAVIAVGAVDQSSVRASFSEYGSGARSCGARRRHLVSVSG